MLHSLELEIATRQMQRFADNSPADRSELRDTLERNACEAYLRLGVDAYKWLVRAEEALIEADTEGVLEWSPEIEEAIRALYQQWLASCPAAEAWAAKLETRDSSLEPLPEFRNCCALARDWLQRDAWQRSAKSSRDVRFAEEPW